MSEAKLQNCKEKVLFIDLKDLKNHEIERVIYILSELCAKLMEDGCVTIKITKNDSNDLPIL